MQDLVCISDYQRAVDTTISHCDNINNFKIKLKHYFSPQFTMDHDYNNIWIASVIIFLSMLEMLIKLNLNYYYYYISEICHFVHKIDIFLIFFIKNQTL